jgi:transcriptional regulator with XRE-family HTH domain
MMRNHQCTDSRDEMCEGLAMVLAPRLQLHLRAIRQWRGITQEELASRANFTRPYITRLESGHADNATLKAVELIAAGLSVHPGQLLGYPGPPQNELSVEMLEAIEALQRVPKHRLAEATKILAILAQDEPTKP